MSKLPPKDDPERTAREVQALRQQDKAMEINVQRSDVLYDTARGMSPSGKKVLVDTEKVLESAKAVLEEKNAGDELQKVVYYGTQAAKDLSDVEVADIPEDLKARAEEGATTTQSLAREGISNAINVARLLVSSPEFRKLVNDILSIIRDVLRQSIASGDEEQRDIGTGVGTDQEKSVDQAIDETTGKLRETVHPIARSAADVAEPIIERYSKGDISFEEAAKNSANTFVSNVRSSISGISLPPEKRDVIINRFKNLIIQTQKSKEYQDALEDFINIVTHVASHAQQLKTHVSQKASEAQTPAFEVAEQNAKELVENFAGHQSLDPLTSVLREFAVKVQEDNELRQYLCDLKDFVIKSLQDPEFVQQTDYNSLVSQLIDRGRIILLENYREISQRLIDEASKFNEALQEDRTTRQFTKDLETLIEDLFLDERGRPTIKLELVKDFAKILPIIGERLKYISLPRIENSDDQYDYVFDNIVLHVSEIVPKHVHMSLNADINLDREENDIVQYTITVDISKLHADARNIAFFYKKKKGMINMMDVGLIDFAVPEDTGMRIHVKVCLKLHTDDKPLSLEIWEARTEISEFKLRLHDTRRDMLYKLLVPLVESRIKRQIENLLTERICETISFIENQIGRAHSQFAEMQQKQKQRDDYDDYAGSESHTSGERRKNPWESPAFNKSQAV
ncbi:2980_t:CDS:2 [Paraglomus brasilianum]|uniref:2980_t:CDS:1 n=1 Tax=Paraglomus brasilianum TaxID=144538 RepID=A0A9N9APV5_9GLOM|nr:2980_t:CDS:2 [Paraglomus brasilianum]